MKLSQAQVKYATERLEQICEAKIKAKSVPLPKKPLLNLSVKEMYAKVGNGTASLRPVKELVAAEEGGHRYTSSRPSDAFLMLFTFDEHETALKEWETATKAAKAVNQKLEENVRRKAVKVMDRIMLSGDAEAALSLLDKFAAED